ncbi:GTP-binding protein [Clostridium grantii]|uniref:CobW/HypB/UreG, nucleotide-binding domain n=1 Tax=Clostridium grantii DSM 8605 TaxID=1121316 RepID=A0A1M5T4F1_9CLOT|nr:GTP-binding protein [Clostridium grantii]SHH45253.1 CobW/HypB/UreG, nucleotide-binding domain [Clostridium grantii DSM 8605]
MKKKIKLYFITGFLGSGKTTFLNLLIEQFKNEKIGIVMNEFGNESIDGYRVSDPNKDLIEINNGAIFCSCLKGTFITALGKLSEHDLDHVFVESSGIGDPSNTRTILELIEKNYGDAYDYKGTIALIDSTNFVELVQVLPAVKKGVIYSDFIVLNKIDLINDERINTIFSIITHLNPSTEIHQGSYCNLKQDFWDKIKEDKINRSPYMDGSCEEKELLTLNLKPTPTSNTPLNRLKAFNLKSDAFLDKNSVKLFSLALKDTFFRIKGDVFDGEYWYQIDLASSNYSEKRIERKHAKSQLMLITTYETTLLEKEEIEKIIRKAWSEHINTSLEVI